MAFWQALLIGIFAYLGRNQVPWLFGTTGGWYGIGRPLVAGAIIGLIMGDVKTGVLCGVAVQALYIGQITPGGAVPSDLNYAAFIGIPLAIAAKGGSQAAIALAVPLGALGVGMHNFTMTINAFFSHKADGYASKGDADKVGLMNIVGTLPSLIERIAIVTAVCYFGAPFAKRLLASLPQMVLHFLAIGGQMLPALGFALLLNQIVSKKWTIFLFMLGWILTSSTTMTITALVIVAVTVALLFVTAKEGDGQTPAAQSAGTDAAAIDINGDEYDE